VDNAGYNRSVFPRGRTYRGTLSIAAETPERSGSKTSGVSAGKSYADRRLKAAVETDRQVLEFDRVRGKKIENTGDLISSLF
jgi:hypothetical protein